MRRARSVFVVLLAAALAACASPARRAPVYDARGGHSSVAAGGDYYVVRRGDTLYSIALDHGADYRDVAQWNGLDDPTKIFVGQRLRVAQPPQGRPPVPPAQVIGRLESRPGPQTARTEAPAQFVWPVKGRILAGFSAPRNKGIDIDAKPGDPVFAAAAGRVTYTGTGIPGLGKLVVIKHDNGFITVYAHNRAILVKEQQSVARGQKIAEVGSSDSERPKLHFEIRKGAAAVDPLLYLPGS